MRTWICLALLALTGCATRHPVPLSDLAGSPMDSWAQVLDRHVDDAGRVDFDGVAAEPDDLEHYVAFVAVAEPDRLGERAEIIAFYINAYNAVAMYNVIHTGVPPDDLLGFYVLQAYQVAGRYTNLYDLENKVIRPLDEPRIHFALNCMVRSCPRLPRVPFTAGDLDDELDAAAREFVNDPRHVAVDDEKREVALSKILDWYRKDFLIDASSVVAYINRYRDDPIPDDYRVRYLDYDWSLNSQTPTP